MRSAAQLVWLTVTCVVGAVASLVFVNTIQGAVATLLFTSAAGFLGCAALVWIDSPSGGRGERVAVDVREAAAAGVSIPDIAAATRLSEVEVRRILG